MRKNYVSILSLFVLLISPVLIRAQAPVLGSTAGFVLFTTTGAVTNTGISQVTGNVGTNTTGGAITGFGNVNGILHIGNGASLLAANELTLLYNQLNIAIPTATHAPLLGNGETLTAGVYDIAGNTTLSNVLTLDGQGDPDALFIFQVSAPFSTFTSAEVNLVNGALACNVFWKVEGAVNMASLTTMRGTVVANNAAIDMGAGVTLEGRALSTTGAITLNGTLAYLPTGCGSPLLTGPLAPNLGVAGCYALFSGNGEVTNAGVSYVIGDIGTNVGITSGFNPLNVNGTIHPIPDISTAACAASLLLATTYLNALPSDIELLHPEQFGRNLVLTPHTYLMNAATSLTDTLYLNAEGNSDAIFVIKIFGALTTSTLSNVVLINGAQAKNIFWIVNGAVSINDYSVFNGTLVSNNGAISLATGVILNGRALTTDGAFNTAAVRVNGPLLDCITLPLTWLSFTAEKTTQSSVLLKWSTANESNNRHFELQRSTDGRQFTGFATVNGSTNPGTVQQYSYVDTKTLQGTIFYRIKQTDTDGRYSYSVIVPLSSSGEGWYVYPNPASTHSTVFFRSQYSKARISLVDHAGKTVYQQNIQLINTGASIEIPLNTLAKGVYILTIDSAQGSKSTKLLVQ